MTIEITVSKYNQMMEEDGGLCINCQAETYYIEPDASDYLCDNCGLNRVYGIEELLVMGEIVIVERPGPELQS